MAAVSPATIPAGEFKAKCLKLLDQVAADRFLVATARQLGATLVTADTALPEFARQGHFVAMNAAV